MRVSFAIPGNDARVESQSIDSGVTAPTKRAIARLTISLGRVVGRPRTPELANLAIGILDTHEVVVSRGLRDRYFRGRSRVLRPAMRRLDAVRGRLSELIDGHGPF